MFYFKGSILTPATVVHMSEVKDPSQKVKDPSQKVPKEAHILRGSFYVDQPIKVRNESDTLFSDN